MEIYIDVDNIGSKIAKNILSDLQTAHENLDRLDNYGSLANARYINHEGYSMPLFPSSFASTAGDLSRKLMQAEERLLKLRKILDSGPDAIAEIDSKQKNQLTNWWDRTAYRVGDFFSGVVSGTVGFFTGLFGSSSATGTETIVRPQYNGPYKNIADDFDWHNTTATNEQIESAVKSGMTQKLGPGEDRNEAVRGELRKLYNDTIIQSEYEAYRREADRIVDEVPVGQKQETERSSSGLCTYSATTTLLQRRQARDGKNVTFTFGDVHRVNGGSGKVDSDGIWPNSSFAFGRTYVADGGESYTMDYRNGAIKESLVVELLNAHPEGIMIYSPSYGGYNHAIAITDYELNPDGSIQFYADDPVNNNSSKWMSGRVPLEKTWLYSQNKDIFSSAVRVAYLK